MLVTTCIGHDSGKISIVICEIDILYRSTKSWCRPKNFRSDDSNLSPRNSWLSGLLVTCKPLSIKSLINWEMYTLYAGASGIMLDMNEKFTKHKNQTIGRTSKSIALSSCPCRQIWLSISICLDLTAYFAVFELSRF